MLIYLHGAPGGPGEIAALGPFAAELGVRLVAIDRASIDIRLEGVSYFQAVAAEIDAVAAGRPYELAGFSAGSFVALKAQPFLKGDLRRLHLISAAAPLETGDFLDEMVGKPVFRSAMSSPARLRMLTRLQGWLARRAPGLLYGMLFTGAAGADRDLSEDRDFRANLLATLSRALNAGAGAYLRDVLAYVTPWADDLAKVTAPVSLWHGDADNWTPLGMAQALQDRLPGNPQLDVLSGASHYSALHQAMPRILAALKP